MNARSPARRFGRTGVALLFRHCGGCSRQVPLHEWQEGPLGCDACRLAAREAGARNQNPINSLRKGQPMPVHTTLRDRPANDAAAAYAANAALDVPRVVAPVTIYAGLGQGARRARLIQRGLTALVTVEIVGLLIAGVLVLGHLS